MMSKVNSRDNKLNALRLKSLNDLTEEQINMLYKSYRNNNDNIKVKKDKTKKQIPKLIDKTTNKYKITLKFVNKLLAKMGENQIEDLTEFRNIDRLDIIKHENKIVLEEMEEEIFKHFNKVKCGYYRKDKSGDGYTLNCLRGMTKEVGLKLHKDRKDIYEGKFRRIGMIYSIKNI